VFIAKGGAEYKKSKVKVSLSYHQSFRILLPGFHVLHLNTVVVCLLPVPSFPYFIIQITLISVSAKYILGTFRNTISFICFTQHILNCEVLPNCLKMWKLRPRGYYTTIKMAK
jgi:hypothetical protein